MRGTRVTFRIHRSTRRQTKDRRIAYIDGNGQRDAIVFQHQIGIAVVASRR